ncbi:MAG: hydroxyacid dehydrogenase [Opitutaceae bacterium]|jgi:phosphoglycerate dehydrogenase-like enzyme|nr:hydroxyacid dehydrogenase [Opitutaceae bacterium]
MADPHEKTNNAARLPPAEAATRPRAAFLLDPEKGAQIYGDDAMAILNECLDLRPGFIAPAEWPLAMAGLADVEVAISGWGAPSFTRPLLDAMPRLKVVFYGAGSVKKIVTDAFWERDIALCCAADANAVAVAEYTVSQVFWLLKDGHRYAAAMRQNRGRVAPWPVTGAYRSTVGLVSLSRIGRLVARRLRDGDLRVIAYDPLASPEDAARLGARLVPLAELFQAAHVVSVHTPLLPETRGMIGRGLLGSMRRGASLINTARGAVIDQEALTETLAARPDLFAVLDVTWPEPPPPESILYDLPNVVLTPHIAGCQDGECRRVGRAIADDVLRYVRGQPLLGAVRRHQLSYIA